tara:strand:+ start:461 stop:637 length:177 start_codon:yes stop_codon:yes gene_type:complete
MGICGRVRFLCVRFLDINGYAVNESIKEGACLFRTIKISDNGNGKALEEKPGSYLLFS